MYIKRLEGEGTLETPPLSVFNKFGSLSKSGLQSHPSFLSNQGYAPTLTLPRREREFWKHTLRISHAGFVCCRGF